MPKVVSKEALDLALGQNAQLLTFLYAMGSVIATLGGFIGSVLIWKIMANTAAATAQTASNTAVAAAVGANTEAVRALAVEIGKRG